MAAAPIRVLCVDDNADVADALADLLRVLGYEARVAAGPTAALADATAFRPQACLIDLRMPGMDGYQTARQMRAALGPDVWLVALSGRADIETASGFDRALPKTADVPALLDALAGAGQPRR